MVVKSNLFDDTNILLRLKVLERDVRIVQTHVKHIEKDFTTIEKHLHAIDQRFDKLDKRVVIVGSLIIGFTIGSKILEGPVLEIVKKMFGI